LPRVRGAATGPEGAYRKDFDDFSTSLSVDADGRRRTVVVRAVVTDPSFCPH
jgi:hypothetical protein